MLMNVEVNENVLYVGDKWSETGMTGDVYATLCSVIPATTQVENWLRKENGRIERRSYWN